RYRLDVARRRRASVYVGSVWLPVTCAPRLCSEGAPAADQPSYGGDLGGPITLDDSQGFHERPPPPPHPPPNPPPPAIFPREQPGPSVRSPIICLTSDFADERNLPGRTYWYNI